MPIDPITPAGGNPVEPVACPCGSGNTYRACCRPLLTGEIDAASPLALMRSRYTAYCLGETDYILSTWAPATRPATIGAVDERVRWLGLEIHGCSAEMADGIHEEVEFSATYRIGDNCFVLRENSRFLRSDGRWLYLDGTGGTTRSKVARNSPCPCGSGKKFKHCCNL